MIPVSALHSQEVKPTPGTNAGSTTRERRALPDRRSNCQINLGAEQGKETHLMTLNRIVRTVSESIIEGEILFQLTKLVL